MGRETGPDTTSSSPPLKVSIMRIHSLDAADDQLEWRQNSSAPRISSSLVSIIGEERNVVAAGKVTSLDKCCQ